ncbi:hypothetical protein L3i20_v200750 [Paenibacillus sp. L3-i20]|nr:hypothetical protein L3i20_v200750 [Paenibacillus sp. L3-i20]
MNSNFVIKFVITFLVLINVVHLVLFNEPNFSYLILLGIAIILGIVRVFFMQKKKANK